VDRGVARLDRHGAAVRVDGPHEVAPLAPDVTQGRVRDDVARTQARCSRQMDVRFRPAAAGQQGQSEIPMGGGVQGMVDEGGPMGGQGALLVTPRLEDTGQGIESMQLARHHGGRRAKLAGGAFQVSPVLEHVASFEDVVGDEREAAIRHHARATSGEEPEEDAEPEDEQGPIDPLQSPRDGPGCVACRRRVQTETMIGVAAGRVNAGAAGLSAE
jgi:hypothetical protein